VTITKTTLSGQIEAGDVAQGYIYMLKAPGLKKIIKHMGKLYGA
jgi:hypothetical protein